jgi:ribosomal protein L37E
MHTKTIADSEGTFDDPHMTDIACRKCGKRTVTVQAWESSCGGYEDHRYTCTCGHFWWVEGPDA